MAEGGGSCMQQFSYLFLLVLRLKSWKFLMWLFVIPTFFLNFLLLKDIEKGDSDGVKEEGITELTMKSSLAHNVLMQKNTAERRSLEKVISDRQGNVQKWIKSCESPEDCKSQFVQSTVGRTDAIYSIMQYGKKNSALYCLNGGKSQILCPHLSHAMSQSLELDAKGEAIFENVFFAKFNDKIDSKTDKSSILNFSAPDSMCTRTTKSLAFPILFQIYFLFHIIIAAAAFILNFTVGTLSSISNLKENGFLQLVFNNGLSVGAFWMVYWTITVLEVLVFSSLIVVAYNIQCPGYYKTESLVNVFLMLTAFFLSLAALGFFFATLMPSFFIILLMMILVQLIFAVMVLMTKVSIMEKSMKDTDTVGAVMSTLIFPPGHIAEYCINQMLPSELPDAFRAHKDFDGYFSAGKVLLIATPIFLIILTIYLDFIVKNGNGLCLPCSYPVNPNFWNPYRQKLIEMVDEQPRRANVEPTIGVPAVIANDIFMTYPGGLCTKRPTVLRGVTCTVYQGQITALIGHNGAGKTTLIRVLMGEEIPTSGVAVINGHRVTDPYQRMALRGTVSICKQVDVLSNYLTVMESMKLTLLAKGFSIESQTNKVLDMMKRLGLAGKENVQAMDLSGGQMRKVCSIISLLGNPRLVILDEPTSGLDPVSRRNLWQILQDHKAGRSIILCTQFMDEADILADRKMFLSAGKLICAGSSLFLKHAFGCCVTINVSLKSEGYTKQVMKLLRKVKLVSQFQTEMQLQVTAEKPQVLADAVQALEDHPELVDAFGVSQAQLDDIFMRLKDIDMDNIEASFKSKKLRKLGRGGSGKVMVEKVDFNSLYNFESSSPMHATFCNQFSALLHMNLSRQWKARIKFIFRILFPICLVVAIAVIGLKDAGSKEKKPAPAKKASSSSRENMQDDSQKTVVIYNLNEPKINKYFFYRGICIVDEGDKFAVAGPGNGSDTSPDTESQEKECQTVFKSDRLMYTSTMQKPVKTLVKDYVKEKDTLKLLRQLCRKSDMAVISCFFVYASSWNTAKSNKERWIYIGVYENPSESPKPEFNAQAFYAAASVYEKMATYFSAYEKSRSRNFTVASLNLAETFNSMKFSDCYELYIFMTAMALIPVTYLNDPIEDKDCGVRKHLASMGMSSTAYWFNTFFPHWLHYFICFLLTSLACLVLEKYQNAYFFVYLVLPVAFLGTTSSQLCVYVVSASMNKTNAVVLVSYFFFAMFLAMIAGYFQDNYIATMILLCALPPITPLIYIMIGMKALVYAMLFFDTKTASGVTGIFEIYTSSDILLSCLAVMPLHIVLLVLLIAVIENPGAILSICSKTVALSKDAIKPAKDEGVKIEADRINKTVRNSVNMLEVRDLQKVYPNGVRAVRGTTFGAFAGEILGLLGPNGAGKTTSMSIIVGEEAESSGSSEVHFTGTWMSGMNGAQCGAIGYCPQHNPLFNSISVFEHLRFYAQIRGIPAELAKAQIAGLIDGLGLKPHQEKAAEQLSGGNKRRLCLAIALLGNPSLIVIDEASTGVDPENKRFIWSAIRGMASKQRSVMITTHSMEEVEALCGRVGIMNKGVMIGFGTVQQLRSRHGESYTLDVLMKAKKPRKLALKKKKLAKRIAKQFKNATVMEDLMSCMQFNLPKRHIQKFSGAMRWLIAKKKSLGIQYFTLYQMSLDQVFVKLVKEYDEA